MSFPKSKSTFKLKKGRIVVVTDYFYPHWTGISKSLYYLTQSLNKDFDLTILTVKHNKSLKKEEVMNEIKILREDFLFNISRAKYSIDLVFKFVNIINKYDVVLINSPCVNIIAISLIAKIYGKKLLIFHQGDLILPRGIINKIIEKIFDISTYLSFSIAHKISTYTKDYADNSRIMKHFPHKFTPLLMPIILNQSKKQTTNLDQIHKLKSQNKILFGFAGRFVEEKGFDILFKAIPLVINKLPQAHFVFAGETKMPYENFYEKNIGKLKAISSYISFLGLLDERKLVDFYKTIDFIVVPSRSDCFSLVQAEAVICEKPTIVSNIPGARVVAQETGFGLIFKKEDPADLAEKLIEAVKKKNMLVSNYPKVLKMFNNQKNVEKIRKFIEN